MPSTFENMLPEFTESGNLKETVFFSNDGLVLDQENWDANVSRPVWTIMGKYKDWSQLSYTLKQELP